MKTNKKEKVTKEIVEHAYKKLKSNVYFDKTQNILKKKIVEFEMEHSDDLDDYLEEHIFIALEDEAAFNELVNEIISSIDVILLPKSLKVRDDNTEEAIKDEVVTNIKSEKVTIDKLQYYIDMSVEGHILGVLWILLVGFKVANSIYEHSYGNKIRHNLTKDLTEETTYSPYLFEPYFQQYESWRDNAMKIAKKHMEDGQDVVIITMDFQRYYYSLDIDEKVMGAICEKYINKEDEVCYKWLNSFVEKVIAQYSKKVGEMAEDRRILPIGFLPSNIIGNWCLRTFDDALVNGWNPSYYGRYVDDIIIVDKLEQNSEVSKKAQNGELTKKFIIDYFLKNCSEWKRFGPNDCEKQKEYALLSEDPEKGEGNKEIIYRINSLYNPVENNKSKIVVQNDKLKIFYFDHAQADSLITCFTKQISKNKSEFRFLPEEECLFGDDGYDSIYSLSNSETLNKLRGIDGISIDKYELSKYLGKILTIGSLINDKKEIALIKDLFKIFDHYTIIENYTMWEKVIEILVLNEQFDKLHEFCIHISDAINKIQLDEKIEEDVASVKDNLRRILESALLRSAALVWKDKVLEMTKDIVEKLTEGSSDDVCISELMKGYLSSRMVDKSVIPVSLEIINIEEVVREERHKYSEVNLSILSDVLKHINSDSEEVNYISNYKYCPYLISMREINLISFIKGMYRNTRDEAFYNLEKSFNREREIYVYKNYRTERGVEEECNIKAKSFSYSGPTDNNPGDGGSSGTQDFLLEISNEPKNKIKVAIANTDLDDHNFENLVKGRPNRSFDRYRHLVQMINMAIDEKADLLVMPEAYVPVEWVHTLARVCEKNKLAVVTGIEHIIVGDKVFNYTAVILPYDELKTGNSVYISFHLKKHYAPFEDELIKGYRLKPVKGSNYEVYKWHDCYFPVYCCYELANIHDRAKFQSVADMLVAVEWNRDVKYYSNILEALSRDMHCYCVQVNVAKYGDSRITQPSKSEEKDIIRTKGGKNSSILVDNIDIKSLRDFQFKEYSLQKDCKNIFKVTPPDFNKKIVGKKIRGESLI